MQYILDYLKYVNVSLGYNIIYMLLRNYEAIDLGHWCLDNQGFTRIGTCTTLEIFIMHCQIHRLYHIICHIRSYIHTNNFFKGYENICMKFIH